MPTFALFVLAFFGLAALAGWEQNVRFTRWVYFGLGRWEMPFRIATILLYSWAFSHVVESIPIIGLPSFEFNWFEFGLVPWCSPWYWIFATQKDQVGLHTGVISYMFFSYGMWNFGYDGCRILWSYTDVMSYGGVPWLYHTSFPKDALLVALGLPASLALALMQDPLWAGGLVLAASVIDLISAATISGGFIAYSKDYPTESLQYIGVPLVLSTSILIRTHTSRRAWYLVYFVVYAWSVVWCCLRDHVCRLKGHPEHWVWSNICEYKVGDKVDAYSYEDDGYTVNWQHRTIVKVSGDMKYDTGVWTIRAWDVLAISAIS